MHDRRLSLLLGVGGLLVGYSVGAYPVRAQQGSSSPFEIGQLISLRYESGGSRSCQVAAISGDFIRCEVGRPDPFARSQQEEWHNVQMATSIVKTLEARRDN